MEVLQDEEYNICLTYMGDIAKGAMRNERLTNELFKKVEELLAVLEIPQPWRQIVPSSEAIPCTTYLLRSNR